MSGPDEPFSGLSYYLRFLCPIPSCACFTKNYGRYITGTGSILSVEEGKEEEAMVPETNSCADGTDDKEQKTGDSISECEKDLGPEFERDWFKSHKRLRYFHPDEICKLHGFPTPVKWPEEFPLVRRFSALGNSLHAPTVAVLTLIAFAAE